MLSLRNTFRRKGRLALTMITLTLSGVIFMSVFSIRNSMLLTLDDALKYFNFDVMGMFSRFYRVEQIEREALAVPGVTVAESWGGEVGASRSCKRHRERRTVHVLGARRHAHDHSDRS
jgi:putative ABC transport system permease protein